MELNLAESGGVFSERVPFRLTVERALDESIKVVYSTDVNPQAKKTNLKLPLSCRNRDLRQAAIH